jgi:group I intron endonuclease
MNVGIYAIRNVINNKRYIGSSSYLNKRYYDHKRRLKNKIHFNSVLQKAWNKYGEQNFVYEILENCDKSILLDREEHWIEKLKSHVSENGYNMCKIPRVSRLGFKASFETILKMKKSLGGKNHPMWGKHLKKETVQKIKDLQTGISKPTSGKRKTFTVISPDEKIIEFTGLRRFCREHNINHSMLWRVLSGKQKEYNGWKSVI